MELLCLLAAVFALGCCLALTPVVRFLATRVGLVDHPGERKIHTTPVAYGGGIALALAMLLALALGGWLWRMILEAPGFETWRSFLGPLKQGASGSAGILTRDSGLLQVLFVCIGGSLGALLLGLADDRWGLSPLIKLLGQVVLAILVVVGGVRVTALVGDTFPMQVLTVLWIVLITNSFNLLDNMDGLCAGVVCISASVLALVALSAGQAPVGLMAASLAGASAGFFYWNRAPARIFLGDAGSLFVGFLMACLTVVTTYYHYHDSVLGVGVPFMLLAIPLYDTASVIVIRIRRGRKIWHGDTNHFSHRLVDLGMTKAQAVGTIHLAALAIALPTVFIGKLTTAEGLLLVGQSLLILTLVALLERTGRKKSE